MYNTAQNYERYVQMSTTLTSNERRVLAAIAAFERAQSRAPTIRELCDRLGLKSTNSVSQYYRALGRKGYLERTGRGIVVKVPLLGEAGCGQPIWATEDFQTYIPVERHLLRNDLANFFFLRAKGDSMDLAGIADGDLLLVEKRPYADAGEIVVALIEGGATVKRYRPGAEEAALVPQSRNPEHQPILVSEDFLLLGVVCKAFKQQDLADPPFVNH